jgi:hypothetical protein
VATLQTEIGDPHAVATHTDLVGYIGEIDARVAAIEHTPEPPTASSTLFVDLYGGSFTRVMASSVTAPTNVSVALATTPGPNGAVFATLGDIAGQGAVWADFGGTLGKVKTADGSDVLGAALKEWIRKEAVLSVHKDTDPAHPNLIVDLVTIPTPAGTSLTLGNLANVVDATDAAADGKLLGVTGGVWQPVDAPAGGSTVAALDDLTDVDVTGAASGDVLVRTGSGWEDRPSLPVVVKATPPTAADYGEPNIPANAVWIKRS